MNILATESTLSPLQAIRPLVRIVVVGHVDHGKSTLIGRLLHETGELPDGKLEQLKAVSKSRGMPFEWAFLLDALQTERDQGITIDTSQIRFRTPSRDVVLIDAPGHTEFLRNMITGAAQADAALLIVDASEGVRDQTRRHGYLLHLLGVRQVVVVINKMDRVGFEQGRFREIESEISAHLESLGLKPEAVIPICARRGDGVARHTAPIDWFSGPTVLEAIDGFSPARPATALALRLPVQAIYKFDERRIIAGRVESGSITIGDSVVVMPSGKRAQIRAIEAWPAPDASRKPRSATAGQSVGITLDSEIFVDRGDIIALENSSPREIRRLRARIFWLDAQPLAVGAAITVRIGTGEARGYVTAINEAVDPGQLSSSAASSIAQNHVGEIEIALSKPLAGDTYTLNPRTGRVVLDLDGRIAGGGLILSVQSEDAARTKTHIVPAESSVAPEERRARLGHQGAVIWLTGLPGSGKSTLARALERRLFDRGGAPVLLDGDTLRTGLNADLGFSSGQRAENVRRIAEVAAHLSRSGIIAIVAAVSPSAEGRIRARRIAGEHFFEIHVAAPVEICERRDPKGHYRKARAGEISGFTGVDSTYEPPVRPELRIDTVESTVGHAVDSIERLLAHAEVLGPRGHDPDRAAL